MDTDHADTHVLELLLADAPPLAGDLGAVVLTQGHRRRRRRWLAGTTGAFALSGAATVAVMSLTSPDPHRIQLDHTPSRSPSTSASPSASASRANTGLMSLEATAVRAILRQAGVDGQTWPVVYVLDRRYLGVTSSPGAERPGGAITPAEQDALRVELRDYAPVRYVHEFDDAYPPGAPGVRDGGIVVTLGVVQRVSPTRARLEISATAGPKGGRGVSYELTLVAGEWAVTGDAGPAWIT